ncbi:MAG: hypothetical protein R3359_07705 [Marinirhabdus sp.]|nr:hypothetical protein [Marinirhabdus sp.]
MITSQTVNKALLVAIFSIGMLSTYAIPTINSEVPVDSPEEFQSNIEVDVSELPQPVNDVVAKYFEGATIVKAYETEKGEFKLVISTGTGSNQVLHANSKGKWI